MKSQATPDHEAQFFTDYHREMAIARLKARKACRICRCRLPWWFKYPMYVVMLGIVYGTCHLSMLFGLQMDLATRQLGVRRERLESVGASLNATLYEMEPTTGEVAVSMSIKEALDASLVTAVQADGFRDTVVVDVVAPGTIAMRSYATDRVRWLGAVVAATAFYALLLQPIFIVFRTIFVVFCGCASRLSDKMSALVDS